MNVVGREYRVGRVRARRYGSPGRSGRCSAWKTVCQVFPPSRESSNSCSARWSLEGMIVTLIDLVERDAARRHRIADYAAELAVTPGHLSVLCTQYAGQRAKRLLDSTLASRARRMLLYTDESAARVGASLGFEDPSYFSRFFRRETGQTPKEFRNALRR